MTGKLAPLARVCPAAARGRLTGAAVPQDQPVPEALTELTPLGSGLVNWSVTVNGPMAGFGPALRTVSVQLPVPPATGALPTALVRLTSAEATCATALPGPAV